jgi:prevent-host-death family protein
METVNVLDARNHLSRLVAVAEHGGEVVIARRGRPVARLVPVEPTEARTAGSFAEWVLANRVRTQRGRPIGAVDAQILAEREAWDEEAE